MGTHLRVLIESFPMNTNITELWWFSKILVLSMIIVRVKLRFITTSYVTSSAMCPMYDITSGLFQEFNSIYLVNVCLMTQGLSQQGVRASFGN